MTRPTPTDLVSRWRSDHLLRNAAYLLAGSLATSGFGFLFWLVVARLRPPEDVGLATSAVSAVSLIAFFSLLGLDVTMVRFLPRSRTPTADVVSALVAVGTTSVAASLGYWLLLPVIAPEVASVLPGPWWALVFAGGAASAATNLLLQSVFIAYRGTGWLLLVQGVGQGLLKVALPFCLAQARMGPFVAWAIASVLTSAGLLVVARARLGLQLPARPRWGALSRESSFATANYLGAVLNLVPTLALPVVVLRVLGPASTAHYYIAFQLASLLYALSYSLGYSLTAEGAHDESRVGAVARRSGLLVVGSSVVAALVAAVVVPPVLTVFGPSYAAAAELSRILCLAAVPVALYTWATAVLRLRRRLRTIVAVNAVLALTAVGGAVLVVHDGLAAVGWAWALANTLAALVALPALRGIGPRTQAPAAESLPAAAPFTVVLPVLEPAGLEPATGHPVDTTPEESR